MPILAIYSWGEISMGSTTSALSVPGSSNRLGVLFLVDFAHLISNIIKMLHPARQIWGWQIVTTSNYVTKYGMWSQISTPTLVTLFGKEKILHPPGKSAMGSKFLLLLCGSSMGTLPCCSHYPSALLEGVQLKMRSPGWGHGRGSALPRRLFHITITTQSSLLSGCI